MSSGYCRHSFVVLPPAQNALWSVPLVLFMWKNEMHDNFLLGCMFELSKSHVVPSHLCFSLGIWYYCVYGSTCRYFLQVSWATKLTLFLKGNAVAYNRYIWSLYRMFFSFLFISFWLICLTVLSSILISGQKGLGFKKLPKPLQSTH